MKQSECAQVTMLPNLPKIDELVTAQWLDYERRMCYCNKHKHKVFRFFQGIRSEMRIEFYCMPCPQSSLSYSYIHRPSSCTEYWSVYLRLYANIQYHPRQSHSTGPVLQTGQDSLPECIKPLDQVVWILSVDILFKINISKFATYLQINCPLNEVFVGTDVLRDQLFDNGVRTRHFSILLEINILQTRLVRGLHSRIRCTNSGLSYLVVYQYYR